MEASPGSKQTVDTASAHYSDRARNYVICVVGSSDYPLLLLTYSSVLTCTSLPNKQERAFEELKFVLVKSERCSELRIYFQEHVLIMLLFGRFALPLSTDCCSHQQSSCELPKTPCMGCLQPHGVLFFVN